MAAPYPPPGSGAIASGTVVLASGTQTVTLGASATLTQVSAGGDETVSSGGVVISATVSGGGSEYVLSSGTASGVVLSGGILVAAGAGAVASGTRVLAAGQQTISLGATTMSTAVSVGGGKSCWVAGRPRRRACILGAPRWWRSAGPRTRLPFWPVGWRPSIPARTTAAPCSRERRSSRAAMPSVDLSLLTDRRSSTRADSPRAQPCSAAAPRSCIPAVSRTSNIDMGSVTVLAGGSTTTGLVESRRADGIVGRPVEQRRRGSDLHPVLGGSGLNDAIINNGSLVVMGGAVAIGTGVTESPQDAFSAMMNPTPPVPWGRSPCRVPAIYPASRMQAGACSFCPAHSLRVALYRAARPMKPCSPRHRQPNLCPKRIHADRLGRHGCGRRCPEWWHADPAGRRHRECTVLTSGGTLVNSGGMDFLTIDDGTELISASALPSARRCLARSPSDIRSHGPGAQDVDSGGTTSAVIVSAGGFQIVESGGTASLTTVRGAGVQGVNSGGTAENSTVLSGGILIGAGMFVAPIISAGGLLLINSLDQVSGPVTFAGAGGLLGIYQQPGLSLPIEGRPRR